MSFTSLNELMELAEKENTTIAQIMLITEEEQNGTPKQQLLEKMSEQLDIMEEAVRKGTGSPVMSRTGLSGGDGYRLNLYAQKGISFIHPKTLDTLSYALSVSEV